MYSLKKSLVTLIGLLVVISALAALLPRISRGQGQQPFARRQFYLTQTEHNGSQALTACADGYHMASLWEIFDPSNLRYNTELGFTQSDSGFGPPTVGPFPPLPIGWIRTGTSSTSGNLPGFTNCQAWTSNLGLGSVVSLPEVWTSAVPSTPISPWSAGTSECDSAQPVWCVQD